VLFDGEEPGSANRFCSGSQVFVDNIEFEEKIIYALIIDMIGKKEARDSSRISRYKELLEIYSSRWTTYQRRIRTFSGYLLWI
jgi:hypothetical protein